VRIYALKDSAMSELKQWLASTETRQKKNFSATKPLFSV